MSQTGTEKHLQHLVVFLGIVVLLLVGSAVRAMSIVTLPLAFAFFLAILVRPIPRWLNHRLPKPLRWLSYVAAMGVVLVTLGLVVLLLWTVGDTIASQAPAYADSLVEKWSDLRVIARDHGIDLGGDGTASRDVGQQVVSWAGTVAASAWSVFAGMVLVLFLTLLMLVESGAWREKREVAFTYARSEVLCNVMRELPPKLRRFLLIRTVVSLISGMAQTGWLWAMGVEHAFVWGILFFVLNYVPYVGSVVATILAVLASLVHQGYETALVVLLGVVAIEQFVGNYVDPRLEGRTLRISPVVVLVSVLLWGWMWGVGGVLIAVPTTVTVILVCGHVPALRPVALLLSREGDPDEVPGIEEEDGSEDA